MGKEGKTAQEMEGEGLKYMRWTEIHEVGEMKNDGCPGKEQHLIDFTTKEFISLTVSRYSPFFNMTWFGRNKAYIDLKMNFGMLVCELLDNRRWRISKSENDGKLTFRFWEIKKGKLMPCKKKVVVSRSGNILNIKKRLCIENQYVYAVAAKLGVMELPRKWETLMVIGRGGFITSSWRIHIDKGIEAIEVMDKFYHKVKIPIEIVMNEFQKFIATYERMKNLKPFQGNYLDNPAFVKAVKKSYKKWWNRYKSQKKPSLTNTHQGSVKKGRA